MIDPHDDLSPEEDREWTAQEVSNRRAEAQTDATGGAITPVRSSRLSDEPNQPMVPCEICGWPLDRTGDEAGCVPGNCSYRPVNGSAEYYRIEKRRAELATKGPRLSDENATFLARIKRQAARGEMSSIAERDKLVEVIKELTK